MDSVDYLAGIDIPSTRSAQTPPVALFLAGGALSGSSSAAIDLLDTGSDVVPPAPVVVDAGMIREELPEWQALRSAGDPRAAHAVRDETLHIARMLVEAACREARNLILVGIGAGEPGEFPSIMRRFADAGYTVHVLVVDIPVDLELRRNQERATQTRLRYDPEELERLNITVAQRFLEWRDEPWISRVELYSTQE